MEMVIACVVPVMPVLLVAKWFWFPWCLLPSFCPCGASAHPDFLVQPGFLLTSHTTFLTPLKMTPSCRHRPSNGCKLTGSCSGSSSEPSCSFTYTARRKRHSSAQRSTPARAGRKLSTYTVSCGSVRSGSGKSIALVKEVHVANLAD